MKIAVASGKGGTGKTTVAVNLALSIGDCTLVDCDVEEPNCSVFLDMEMESLGEVNLIVPEFDREKCTYCQECADFCAYNAIGVFPERLIFFPELCHGCGGCAILCPADAISEKQRPIGILERGEKGGLKFYQGLLDVGEPMSTPIIRALKSKVDDGTVIYDAPPGNACPMIETVQSSDFVLLVTEPTPFGLHDLKLAVDVVNEMDIPFGVVVNRQGVGDDRVERYCEEEDIPLLLSIPQDRKIAELYSEGIPFVLDMEEYRDRFLHLIEDIEQRLKELDE